MTLDIRERSRSHLVAIALLVLAPILVGLLHDDWLFSPIGLPDPYFNVGFFMHYFDPEFLPGMYKEARVPWLAPGYFAYHTVGPMAANFVLHIGCLVAAVVLVYLTLSRLVSRNAAFIASALLCSYYQFQGSSAVGGWDYQTTPSGALYALTLYLLVRAAQTEYAAFWLAGAGIAFGATFHSNIVTVNLTPGIIAIYLVATRFRPSIVQIGGSVLWALLGFILINLLFSVIAWDSGRDPMFFRSMLSLAGDYTSNPAVFQQRWWKSWSTGWYMEPIYLAYLLPLAAVFIASLAWLAERIVNAARQVEVEPDERASPAGVVLVGQYVFAIVLWLIWQTQGQTALQPDCFAYPLIIPAFMALAAMIGPVGKREMIGLVAVLVFVVIADALLAKANSAPDAKLATRLVTVAFFAAIAASVAYRRFRGLALLGASAVYLAAYPAMALTHQAMQPLWSELPIAAKPCVDPKLYFSETVRLNKLLRPAPGEVLQTWVWDGPDGNFDSKCPVPIEYFRTTLLATGLTALGSYHATADQLDDAEIRLAQRGDKLVAIVGDKSQLVPLVARFKRSNFDLVATMEQKVNLGHASAVLTVFELQ